MSRSPAAASIAISSLPTAAGRLPAWVNAKASARAARAAKARKSSNRRRFVDPATCERDYSAEEVEFMDALDKYKRSSGRMFPTCSEILEVIRGLGYVKAPFAGTATGAPDAPQTAGQ